MNDYIETYFRHLKITLVLVVIMLATAITTAEYVEQQINADTSCRASEQTDKTKR